MKKYIRILLLVPLALFLTAMAQRGDEAPIKVPETGANIKVVITDIKGLKTELTEFSMDGNTMITGERGKGYLSIPFNKIKEISFIREDNNKIKTVIQTIDGKEITMLMRGGGVFYGNTEFGPFKIEAESVSRIEVIAN
ncbi:hypothetical protein BMS3Abin06_02463 [bacterium BMS3Abin06]|nr:hypothetical protein BMS3Abin06_02463 [bacterium BMS3Abin06]